MQITFKQFKTWAGTQGWKAVELDSEARVGTYITPMGILLTVKVDTEGNVSEVRQVKFIYG
uniref:Uncharacterized protein n=1 Tax=viral metagenome TaxID=1070528 RepID=A0A6M3KVS9_9ZZZZ